MYRSRHPKRLPVPPSRGERIAHHRARRLEAAPASSEAFWKQPAPAELKSRHYNAQPETFGLLRRNVFQARYATAVMLCPGHRHRHGCEQCGPHGSRPILWTLDLGFGDLPSVTCFEAWTVVHVSFRSSGSQLSWREITELHCHGVLYEINPAYLPGRPAVRNRYGRQVRPELPASGPKYIAYYLRHWDHPRRQHIYRADRRRRNAGESARSETEFSGRTERSGTLQLPSENGLPEPTRRYQAFTQAARQMAAERVSKQTSMRAWREEVIRCMVELRDIEIPKNRAAKDAKSDV